MNFKTKLVLWFSALRKPIDPSGETDIAALRKKSESSARLGAMMFDKKHPVAHIADYKAGDLPLRVYRQTDKSNQRIIIFYHGGGFVFYGLDSHDNICRRLCMMNDCVVVSVDYRLAPENTFPAAHEDAFTAIEWVKKNADSFNGNANDLVLMGDSAGGNLAACMAHRCREAQIPLSAQVLIYPWIDGKLNNPSIDRNGSGYLLEKATMFWFQHQYTPNPADRCLPEVSPCYATDFAHLAPAFILTAEFDPLLDDGAKYAEQLRTAGVPLRYTLYPQLIHGFFNIPAIAPQGLQAFEDIRQFLKTV